MSSLKLLNDLAIEKGRTSRTDGLGFETYARVLGDAALGTPGPFTIGVFGEWGTGKTSLLHLMQSYIEQDKNVVTVWFNAWKYEKEEHPIIPLLATIIRELQINQSFLEGLADQGRILINALRAVAYGFSTKSNVKVPGIAEVEASFVAKEMVDRAEALSNDPLLNRSLYYEAFERLSKIKIGNGKKIIVFVDDLDRCFPDSAIKLLESIKLVLSQPGFIFVLGVARTVIEGYLQHRYQKEYGLENFNGIYYLDKIVQLPFNIPPHHERVNQFCECLLKQLSKSDINVFATILPTIARTTGVNPRATIRFVNNLLIDRAINQVFAETNDMELIPIEYFAVTRILQRQWNSVFLQLIASPELASQLASWKIEKLIDYSNSEVEENKIVAKRLLSDKLLSDLLFSTHGQSWLTNESTRTATVSFIKHRTQEAEGYSRQQEYIFNILVSYHGASEAFHQLMDSLLENDVNSLILGVPDPKSFLDDSFIKTIINNNIKGYLLCIGKTEGKNYLNFIQHEYQLVRRLSLQCPNRFPIIPVLLPGGSKDDIPQELLNTGWFNMSAGLSEKKVRELISIITQINQNFISR